MHTGDSLEVYTEKTEVLKTSFAQISRNKCSKTSPGWYSQKEKHQTTWGKMGYGYLKKLNVFKSKEPCGVFPELGGQICWCSHQNTVTDQK